MRIKSQTVRGTGSSPGEPARVVLLKGAEPVPFDELCRLLGTGAGGAAGLAVAMPKYLPGVAADFGAIGASEGPYTPESIASALAVLPVKDFADYTKFRNVLFAVKSANPDAWDVFDVWARGDAEKYGEAGNRAMWDAAAADRDGGIGPGTLVKLAREHGWQGRLVPVADASAARLAAAQVANADGMQVAPSTATSTAQAAAERAGAAVRALNLRMDQFGEARIATPSGGRLDWPRADSAAAMDNLILAILSASGKTPSRELIERELAALRALARHEGRRVEVFVRVARVAGGFALDLGDGRMVEIGAGGWRVVSADPVAFVRPDGYGILPEPAPATDPATALRTLTDWTATLGVPAEGRGVLVAALVNALRVGVPYPIIELVGSAGSGKSSTAWALGSLIDPSGSGNLPDAAVDAEALASLAASRHVLLSDNASSLSRDAQDLACKTSTGTEIAMRRLYTQGEVVRLPLHRPLLITAVSPVLTRGDAIDRTIRVVLPPREGKRSEEQLRADFRAQHPALLSSLCTLLAAGLARLPEVQDQREWTHRLVDFVQIGEAVTQAAGNKSGAFIDAFDIGRRATAREVVSGDPFALAVRKALREFAATATPGEDVLRRVQTAGRREWARANGRAAVRCANGSLQVATTVSALREQIGRDVDSFINGGRGEWFPKSDRAMSDALLRVTPLLRDVGIRVDSAAPWAKTKVWRFEVAADGFDDE